jgi:hypothetical protein
MEFRTSRLIAAFVVSREGDNRDRAESWSAKQVNHARWAESVLAAFGIISCLAPHVARAQAMSQAASSKVIEITTRPTGDTIQWGQLNLAPSRTFPTPQGFASFGGIDGRATVDKNGIASIAEQCCVGLNGTCDGNFAPGDILFNTSNTALTLTLDFKQPLKSVGTQIQANVLATFVAQIQAFHHHKLLATFMESSDGNLSAGDNSAIFLGVMSPKADITSVVYSVTINGSPDGFAINQVTTNQ